MVNGGCRASRFDENGFLGLRYLTIVTKTLEIIERTSRGKVGSASVSFG